jgi:diacylglycerol kinase (ATP)
MVVIGNSQLYGGVVKLTAHALLNDGLLDVCVIKGRSMLAAPLRLVSIFTRNYNRDPKVEYYRAKRVQIKGKKSLPVQVDGDYLDRTPMNFEVVPGGLWVLVPPSADMSLWKVKLN